MAVVVKIHFWILLSTSFCSSSSHVMQKEGIHPCQESGSRPLRRACLLHHQSSDQSPNHRVILPHKRRRAVSYHSSLLLDRLSIILPKPRLAHRTSLQITVDRSGGARWISAPVPVEISAPVP